MASVRRVRCTNKQLEMLVDMLSKGKDLACGNFSGPMGHQSNERRWAMVANDLSKHGPTKTADQWQTTWRDLKKKARKNRAAQNRAANATGNTISIPELTELERKILALIGEECAVGIGMPESGFGVEEENENVLDVGNTQANEELSTPPPPKQSRMSTDKAKLSHRSEGRFEMDNVAKS